MRCEVRLAWSSAKAHNNYLIALRGIFGLEYRGAASVNNPLNGIENMPVVKKLPDPLTNGERDKILTDMIAELPEHLAAMAEFSLQTGLRRANVTHMEWSQVDLARKNAWVTGDKTKNRKALAVPLSSKAVAILEAWRGKHPRWVFPKAGKPVQQTSTKAWFEALQRAGIEDFCWHDLRHTWASWHVQNGTPLYVLQELGGWSSLKMVQRYAHLSGEHLRAWVESPALRLVANREQAQTGTYGDFTS